MGLTLDIQAASAEELCVHAQACLAELARRGEQAFMRVAYRSEANVPMREAQLACTGISFDTRTEAEAFAASLDVHSCERLVQAAIARCRPLDLLIRLRGAVRNISQTPVGAAISTALAKIEQDYRADTDGVVSNR